MHCTKVKLSSLFVVMLTVETIADRLVIVSVIIDYIVINSVIVIELTPVWRPRCNGHRGRSKPYHTQACTRLDFVHYTLL